MSNTPRTDGCEFQMFIGVHVVSQQDVFQAFQFARLLERELNEMERIAAVRLSCIKLIEDQNDAANERIKRLEEAGDKLHWAWMNPFDPAGETIADNWTRAKQDKL